MKKIIIITMLLLSITAAKAQEDTLQWLNTNIADKSARYKGKPLSTLLADLKYRVKNCNLQLPEKPGADTIYRKNITLFFDEDVYSPANALQKDLKTNKKYTYIEVTFTEPVPVPVSALQPNGALSRTTWTGLKDAFYGKYLVASVKTGKF